MRWLIRILSSPEWAEAMTAEADHILDGPARRRWLSGAARSAVARNALLLRLGLLIGVGVAGLLVSQALWNLPGAGDGVRFLLALANIVLVTSVAGFLWLTRPAGGARRWTVSGFIAAIVAGCVAMPSEGPLSEFTWVTKITLPLMMASVGAVVAVALARMASPDHVTRATMLTWMWAAVLTFVLGIASGAGAA